MGEKIKTIKGMVKYKQQFKNEIDEKIHIKIYVIKIIIL